MIDRYNNQELDVIKLVVKESIQIYNLLRPHCSNYMLTPMQMNQQKEIEMKTYKIKTEVTLKLLLSKKMYFYYY